MDKKALDNVMPLNIKTKEEIEEEKNKFFQKCERIVSAPACIFLEGNRFSRKAKLLSLPFYAYAGIEKGNYDRFMYEEHEWSESNAYYIQRARIREELPKEEKVMFKSRTPLSSIRQDRQLHYQIYLHEEFKKQLIEKGEFEKALKEERIHEIFQRNCKDIDYAKLGDKFKDYFKIKVWSEIPSNIGLNEGAAIASAVTLLLVLELHPDNESRSKSIQNFVSLKINRPEEILVDWFLMELFTNALKLDFFSNGSAVFASIMGNTRKHEIIDYECLFYNDLKRFFEPRPEINIRDQKSSWQEFDNILKERGINVYFEECKKLSERTRNIIPLFGWSHSRLSFKNEQEVALSVMHRGYISAEDRDFKISPDAKIKLYPLSPAAFTIIGGPSDVVLCEKRPEKYIFGKEKDEVYSVYSPLYSSRKQEWEVEGVHLVELKKPEKIRDTESTKLGETRAEIKFFDTEVQISGQSPLSKNNPLILAEHIILKEKVHWIWAFVILPEFETKKPKWQFRNYVSKEKALLRQHGIRIVALKKAEDDYAKLEGVEKGVISNIEDIKISYNKALSIFNKGKIKEAIAELNKMTDSDYRWYSFSEAYIRLTEWLRILNFEGIPDKLIVSCRDFFTWYRKRLQIGIGRVELYKSQLLKSHNKLDKLTEDEFQKIKEELKKVEENLDALANKIPLSKEELDYEALVSFLIDLKEKLMYVWENEREHEEARQEASMELISRLQDSNICFKGIINNAFSLMGDELYKLHKSKTYSDKSLREESREIFWFLRDLIIEIENFDDFELKGGSRLGMLTNYFNAGLENRIKKWLSGRA